jgi:hypothetical protein
MWVLTYKTTQHHNPEDHNPLFYHHENLKSHIIILFLEVWYKLIPCCQHGLTLYISSSHSGDQGSDLREVHVSFVVDKVALL